MGFSIQGWHDCWHIGVEFCRLHMSAVCLEMETVGYMEPYMVGWSEVVGNGCAHFHVVCNFTRVVTLVGDPSHLSH